MTNNKDTKPLKLKGICKVGCAGWNLPQKLRQSDKSYLERYSDLFDCVEINSSFYRHHQQKTYARWKDSVPEQFKFSVKVPKTVSHANLFDRSEFSRFLNEVQGLEEKLDVILIQFPPKRNFDENEVKEMFSFFRGTYQGRIVAEPRHSSWFEAEAKETLLSFNISYVGADPKAKQDAPNIFDDDDLFYFRLHGSPRIYYSSYSEEFLKALSAVKCIKRGQSWIVFDNTAAGYAFDNALYLRGLHL